MLEQNKLEFYVARTASKLDVKGAVKALFQVEVSKVNTRITKEGKLAIVKVFHNLTLLLNREVNVKSQVFPKENVLAELVSIVEIEVRAEQNKMLLEKS